MSASSSLSPAATMCAAIPAIATRMVVKATGVSSTDRSSRQPVVGASPRRYDAAMTSKLRVLVEQPTRGKRWVAVAADWPGLERGAKTEDEAVEKLVQYVPRYLPVAKRARLGSELTAQT